jgi:hypothetical protein
MSTTQITIEQSPSPQMLSPFRTRWGNDLAAHEGNPDFVLSLARGLKVIACFEGHPGGLTIAEISRTTALPAPPCAACSSPSNCSATSKRMPASTVSNDASRSPISLRLRLRARSAPSNSSHLATISYSIADRRGAAKPAKSGTGASDVRKPATSYF